MGKILKVAPSQISMCTGPSPFVDNTHSQLNLSHPHADVNRGWFEVNATKAERTVNTDWDMTIGPKFESLIEFKSIYNHIFQIQNWRESLFAQRIKNWMEMDGKVRKLHSQTNSINDWIIVREKEIDSLICSMKNTYILNEIYNENIGVNISRNGKFLFNKVGHHRLSIAKCLDLKFIFVIPIVIHTNFNGFLHEI